MRTEYHQLNPLLPYARWQALLHIPSDITNDRELFTWPSNLCLVCSSFNTSLRHQRHKHKQAVIAAMEWSLQSMREIQREHRVERQDTGLGLQYGAQLTLVFVDRSLPPDAH